MVKPLCVEESEIDWLTGSAVLQGVCDTDVSLHPFSFFHGQFTRKRTKRENLVEVCFQERKKIHPQSPHDFSKGNDTQLAFRRTVHELRPLDAKGQRDKTTLEATVPFWHR